MRILLLGKNGQVGWELQRSLAPLGEVLALDRDSAHYCGDLSQQEGLVRTVMTYKPDFIVNAAGYTQVDKAESEPDFVRAINVKAPAALAKAAAEVGAWFIHYSTDYVFDGSGTHAWQEGEGVGPLSVYGQTKQEAEQAIAASGCKYIILRTSWVFAAKGDNFLKTILRLALERERLTVINDQYGAPTSADFVADITAHIIRHVSREQNVTLGGLYHLSASGVTSWYEYAFEVVSMATTFAPQLPWRIKEVLPVTAAKFATTAKRPLNSRLCTNKIQQTFGLVMPSWRQGVERAIKEILQKNII